MKRITRGVVCILILTLLAGACTSKRVDESHVGVRYTDGAFDGKHFDKVVNPGGTEWVWNDKVYLLPIRQVSFNADGDGMGPGQDAPAQVLTARGGETMNVSLSIRFFLNTRPEVIRPFFNTICRKYHCWDGVDESEKRDDGWDHMLRDTFGSPMKTVINDVGLEFDAEDLRYDNRTRIEFGKEFAEDFVKVLQDQVGRDDFFCGPGFDRDGRGCPDLSVKITSITFRDSEREKVRGDKVLADKRIALAEQQAKANTAQARADQNLATPAHIALVQAEAMAACSKNPQCTLIINTGGTPVQPAVPTGK